MKTVFGHVVLFKIKEGRVVYTYFGYYYLI